MIGELTGQVIAFFASFGLVAAKAGQIPSVSLSTVVRAGDRLSAAAVTVDVASPAVAGVIVGTGMAVAEQQQHAMASEGKDGGAKSSAQAPKNVPRYQGTKPKYHVNEAHVKGSGRYNPRKDPLPADAAEVYEHAVPDAPTGAKNWYSKNASGEIYRYSNAGDGAAHFSGTSASKDGIRNITEYAEARLEGK